MDRYLGNTKDVKDKEIQSQRRIIATHHKFLWDEDKDKINSVEKEIAKIYDDQFFKEFCIGDLSNYELNKIALRWRTQKEVISGKGETICGNKECNAKENLRSWEVNFKYMEHGTLNQALVKLRLCPPCSYKLNYHKKKKEWVDKRVSDSHEVIENEKSNELQKDVSAGPSEDKQEKENSIWDSSVIPKMDQNSNEEMTAYLLDLFYLKRYEPN